MPLTVYEQLTTCDNCGRVVSRSVVDRTTFDKLTLAAEPADDELYEDPQDRPVQVIVTHVPLCSRCSART